MKQIKIATDFNISLSKLFIWAFIPYRTIEEQIISKYYDNPETRQELSEVFAEIGLKWKWQPITHDNMQDVVEEIIAQKNEYIPIVLNYCDGDDINGYPGVSVVKLLEEKQIIFTGANSSFYELSTSKILMKDAFVRAGVATSPYQVILDPHKDSEGVCERLGTPLIVKPAISASSYGITLKSVVNTDQEVRVQVEELQKGQKDWQFSADNIFVERFINGREFTVLIVGSYDNTENFKIYPPVERVFKSDVPEEKRFLYYEQYTEKIYESEYDCEDYFYRYQKVGDSQLEKRLSELSDRAYRAVGGVGYARVDIRMDKTSQELFVLEVNANCGIASIFTQSGSSVGNILHLANVSFSQLILDIITNAISRHPLL